MGYESKFYVVSKSTLRDLKAGEKTYGQIIAFFDLCKIGSGPLMSLVAASPPTDCYIYADDGNTQILEDNYGDPLVEMSVPDVIEALESDDMEYRRIPPFLECLTAVHQDPQWANETLAVLHFGY